MVKTSRSARSSAAKAPVVVDVESAAAGLEAACEHYRAEALALPESEVLPCRADPVLALYNVYAGVAAVEAERATLAADPEAPRPDWEAIAHTRTVAAALVFAAKQVMKPSLAKALAQGLAEAYQLRALLLAEARLQRLRGKLPAKTLRAIEAGSGSIDAAQDCVALAAALRALSKKGVKLSVTGAELRRAAELGASLVTSLAPGAARKKRAVDPERAAQVALRDRLWTLLVRAYDRVLRVAAWRWQDDAGEHAPALQSRRSRKKSAAVAAPTAG